MVKKVNGSVDKSVKKPQGFQKGNNANPNGRPKGSKNGTFSGNWLQAKDLVLRFISTRGSGVNNSPTRTNNTTPDSNAEIELKTRTRDRTD